MTAQHPPVQFVTYPFRHITARVDVPRDMQSPSQQTDQVAAYATCHSHRTEPYPIQQLLPCVPCKCTTSGTQHVSTHGTSSSSGTQKAMHDTSACAPCSRSSCQLLPLCFSPLTVQFSLNSCSRCVRVPQLSHDLQMLCHREESCSFFHIGFWSIESALQMLGRANAYITLQGLVPTCTSQT